MTDREALERATKYIDAGLDVSAPLASVGLPAAFIQLVQLLVADEERSFAVQLLRKSYTLWSELRVSAASSKRTKTTEATAALSPEASLVLVHAFVTARAQTPSRLSHEHAFVQAQQEAYAFDELLRKTKP